MSHLFIVINYSIDYHPYLYWCSLNQNLPPVLHFAYFPLALISARGNSLLSVQASGKFNRGMGRWGRKNIKINILEYF